MPPPRVAPPRRSAGPAADREMTWSYPSKGFAGEARKSAAPGKMLATQPMLKKHPRRARRRRKQLPVIHSPGYLVGASIAADWAACMPERNLRE